jgi:tetratricopeptide (TPR) repeat protein
MDYDWDWSGTEDEFRRAIELNPTYPTAHHWYALALVFTGRHGEAFAAIERARKLDPQSLIINTVIGYVHFHARRFDEAIQYLEKALEMDRDFMFAHSVLRSTHLQLGMYEQAINETRELLRLGGEGADDTLELARPYALAGRREEAVAALERQEGRSGGGYVPPGPMALGYVALEEADRAIEWLERAHDERLWVMITLRSAEFDPSRADPRFQDLMRRVGLPPV